MQSNTAADGVSKRLLIGSFASILILLILIETLAYVESRSSQRQVGTIVSNALRSVELVGQIGMDVQREHMLTERHILESGPAGWNAIERQLAANRADFHKASTAYGEHVTLPGEFAAWYQLADDIAAKDYLAPAVIDLSLANRDAEARQHLVAMQPLFDAIQADVARLVGINRMGAEHARDEMERIGRDALRFRVLLGVCIALVLVSIGAILTHVLVRNERALHAKTQELEDKNRELDAFAGRVAHDLRGPLSAISVASYLLAERVPQQSKTTGILQRGVTQMSNLVEELLALSRIGVLSGAVGRTEPAAAAIAEDLAPRVREAGGTLHVELAPASVRCSDGMLRQILWNLGENALKYRRPDVVPAISLTGDVDGDRYRIAVNDNGLGMTGEDADHMFEPFFRAQRTSAVVGTGLGLAIVRRIIDACGGTVAVTSEVGRGTRIEIRLPLAEPATG